MAKAAGTEPGILPLPTGGGAQRAIDETFQTDLSTGSGFYEIPLKLPRGVRDLTPTLGLKYSTGAGNGPFGIGWSLNLPTVTRRTERRGLRFDAGVEDTFYLDSKELTPVGGGLYRQVVESEASTLRYAEAADSWTLTTKTGAVLRFGLDPGARTGVAAGTLQWHLSRIEDGVGNAVDFAYARDGGRAYLTSVRYAIYEILLQYEDRPDAFADFRSGEEVRTGRRCTSIDVWLLQPQPQPVKSYRLGYRQAPYSEVSLLERVQLVALDQPVPDDPLVELPLEPVTFEYSTFDPAASVLETFTADAVTAPPALTGADLTLLDLDGVGRPGVIEIRGGTARFWPSRPGLRWGSPRTITDLPLNADLSEDALRFVDMDGDGTADLLVGTARAGGYFPHTAGGGWGPMVRYRSSPSAPLSGPGVRFLDLDGDNRVDVVHSDDRAFYHYFNAGREGWDPVPVVVPRRHRLEEWPDVDLADPHVRFADVVGDGRSHLVVVHDGRVVYYPNLGSGSWAAMRRMSNAPRLPRHYDPARLFLADVDGDGTADLLYVDFDCVRLWLNRSGSGFSDEVVIPGTPPVATVAVIVADMKGCGTNGVLFSYAASLHRSRDYRYLDLAGGAKPLLLRRITNNRRVTTEISYGSSTEWPRDTADPELVGRASFLPFPVPVVSRMETTDPSTGVVAVSRFAFWNGNYDGTTRTFLGFGKAERVDEGDDSVPANRNVCYFHNDSTLLKGAPRRALVFGEDDSASSALPFEDQTVDFNVEVVHTTPAGVDIRRALRSTVTTRTHEREAGFDEVRTEFSYDQAGNAVLETRTCRWTDDRGTPHEDTTTTRRSYAVHPDRGLTGLPCRETVRDGSGTVLTDRRTFYDGAPFEGLPLGEATRGCVTRVRDFVLATSRAQEVYATGFPDLASLGYVRETDPVLGDAYVVDTFAQQVDARGNLVERRDAVGTATSFQFDPHGIHPERIAFANGLHVEARYEYKYGGITRYVEVNGVAQDFRFDVAGRLTGVLRFDDPPDQPYLEYEYVEGAPLSSQTTLTRSAPGGPQHRRVEYFDGLGQTLQVRAEAEGGRVTVTGRKEFNAKGLVAAEYQAYFSDGLGFSVADQNPATHTRYSYDARGRSTGRVGWEGEVYLSRYGRGHVTHADPLDLEDEAGNPHFDTPRTEWHDADGRVVAVLEPHAAGTYTTRYTYDAVGHRIHVEINGSTAVENDVDGLGRRIRSHYRDAGTWRYLFDAAGRLVQRTDGKGDVVHRTQDALGRLLRLRYGGETGPVQEEYRYDTDDSGDPNAAGNLVSVSGPFGEVRYTYGECRCVKTKTRAFPGLAQAQTVTYTTDSLKRFVTIAYPDGFEQKVTYNAGGLIDSLPGVIDTIDYGPTGRRTKVQFVSGVVTEYRYDPASLRLTGLRTTAPDGVTRYQDLGYDYDELGSVTGISDDADRPGHIQNDRTFSYDGLQQLLTATGTGPDGAYVHSYEYDRWGNIARYPEQFGDDRLLYEDAAFPFRITGVENRADNPYDYDDAGNLVRSLHNRYEYDARNRLVRTVSDTGTVTTHRYDHVGNRVVSTVTSDGVDATTFTFDDIYVLSGDSAVKVIYDDRSQVAAVRSDGTGVVFHKDHLGSHTLESDLATGAALAQQDYFAFGLTARDDALAAPFGFTGKKLDSTDGLVYFGGRYFLPETGRFLTPDPYFLEQQPDEFFRAPRSLELYVYVLNNPLNMVDPYGLFFGIDDLIVAAVGFVVGVAAYAINVAVSGGDFSFSEMLFSGLMGAATAWVTYSTLGVGAAIIVGAAMLAKPAISGALDKASMGDSFGERLLGFVSFAIKFASSPITSTVGLLIGGFGTGFGLWGNVEWFKGGVIAFEYSPGASAFSAVTLGATVNIWQGNTSAPDFEHELYHSRQYTHFGDAFVPAWVLGGVWGLVSSAIAGQPQWSCFSSANPSGGYGNPLESSAHSVERGGGCT